MLTAMVLNNLWWALRLALGRITSHSFATHSASSVEESVAYIRGVFEDYKRYGSVERFRGSVAEVGPGDNAGVALLVRADGAETVDLVDRYAAWLDPAQQARIYERLAQQYPNVDTLREGRSWRDCVHSGIAWHTGRPAEKHFRDHAQHGGLYDFILSRAVMEHLYDPLDGLHAMILAVRPGGRLIHKIDLRDHELFSPPGHPLTWLTIPRWTWQLATR
jgi:SAM-dependent methyltransferase